MKSYPNDPLIDGAFERWQENQEWRKRLNRLGVSDDGIANLDLNFPRWEYIKPKRRFSYKPSLLAHRPS